MGTRVYPSLANWIGNPSSIQLGPNKTTVVKQGEVLINNQKIIVDNDEIGLAKGFDRLYPLWRTEKEFLQCSKLEEYSARIQTLLQIWASNRLNHTFTAPKYIPPGKQAAWRASLKDKESPLKLLAHPLAINSYFALIAVKVDEKDDFRIAFCKLDGTLKGFYRSTSLELPFISNACLIGNKGFVVDAKTIYHFAINDLKFEILWQKPNPTYPKAEPSNAGDALLITYAEMLLTANNQLLLIGKPGAEPFVLDPKTGDVKQRVPTLATSLYLTESEITCGTADGRIAKCTYKIKGDQIKLYPKVNQTIELAKQWEPKLNVPPQSVNTHACIGNFTVASLENAFIMSDSAADNHSVVNEVERIVSIAFIGDLVLSLSQSYTLYLTPLCQSVPVKKIQLYKECRTPPMHRQLISATPHCVWILAPDGEISKLELLE
jgi:hypothetical protein